MNGAPVEKLVYSFVELCEVLDVSDKTAREWMHRSQHPLPFLKTNGQGRALFPKEAVRQWLLDEAARQTGETAESEFASTAKYQFAPTANLAAASTARRAGTTNGHKK